jgi:hypothetical protein
VRDRLAPAPAFSVTARPVSRNAPIAEARAARTPLHLPAHNAAVAGYRFRYCDAVRLEEEQSHRRGDWK